MKKSDQVLQYLMLHHSEEWFTTQEIAEVLNMHRTNLSRILNQLCVAGLLIKKTSKPVLYRLNLDHGLPDVFMNVVGRNHSLKPALEQGIAAIRFPDYPIDITVSAPEGAGSSLLLRRLLQYDREIHPERTNVVSLRCEMYGESYFIDGLPGHQMPGLARSFEQAQGGTLIVQGLDRQSDTMVSMFMDYMANHYKTPDQLRMIVTVDPETETEKMRQFADNLEVRLSLPSLSEWRMKDRFDLICHFLQQESAQFRKTIEISAQPLACLLLYHDPSNIKGMKKSIRNACIQANSERPGQQRLTLMNSDFSENVRQAVLSMREKHREVFQLISPDSLYLFSPDGYQNSKEIESSQREKSLSRLPGKTGAASVRSGSSGSHRKEKKGSLFSDGDDLHILQNSFQPEIASFALSFLQSLHDQFGFTFSSLTAYETASTVLQLVQKEKPAVSCSLNYALDFIRSRQEEGQFCLRETERFEKTFGLHISPADLIGLFEMATSPFPEDVEKGPVIVLCMHGMSVASSMAEAVRSLLQTDNVYAFDLPLNDSLEKAYIGLKEVMLHQVPKNRPVLFLYDMGGFVQMFELLKRTLQIDFRAIEIPSTSIVLEASWQALQTGNLEETESNVLKAMDSSFTYRSRSRDRGLLIYSSTAEIDPALIREYVENTFIIWNTEIEQAQNLDSQQVRERLDNLSARVKKVYAIGDVDPHMEGITFIPVESVMRTTSATLNTLDQVTENRSRRMEFSPQFQEFIENEYPDVDFELLSADIVPLIRGLGDLGFRKARDYALTILLYLAGMIHTVQNGSHSRVSPVAKAQASRHKTMAASLKSLLARFEKTFLISFDEGDTAEFLLFLIQLMI